jgi:hypothetical protein
VSIFSRLNNAYSTAQNIASIIGYFGVSGWIAGVIAAVSGSVWAVITHVSLPIVIMAAFCTFTAAVYLGLVPVAFRALERVNDAPRARPDPTIWRHVPELRLFEAACLLADVIPSKPAADRPGDANAWYRALVNAVRSGELNRIHTPLDDQHNFITGGYMPHPDTVITSDSLRKFAEKCQALRPFLVQGFAP